MRAKLLSNSLATALAALTAVATVPVTAVAAAAPSDADLEEARKLYERGRKSFEAGDFVEAAGSFVSAYELSGEPNLLYNASYAYEQAYEYEKALEYMKRYREKAPPEEHASLDDEIARIEGRLEATEESETKTPEPATPPPEGPIEPAGGEQTDAPGNNKKIYGPGAAVLTATTVLGAGMAIGFGVAALNRSDAVEDACMDGGPEGTICADSAEQDEQNRRIYAALADTGIAIGVLSAIGLTTVLLINRKRAKSQTAFRVSPNVNRSTATVSLSGRF